MRIAIVTLALLLPAASAAEAPPQPLETAKPAYPTRVCRDAFKVQPVREPKRIQPKRLDQLPSGDLYLSVVNEVGGCLEPVKVKEGYGR